MKEVMLSLSTPLRNIGVEDIWLHFSLTRQYIVVGGKRHTAAAFLQGKTSVSQCPSNRIICEPQSRTGHLEKRKIAFLCQGSKSG